MLWMLLVYVVVSNGYAGVPTLAPSFRGQTFASKQECDAAARQVSMITTPGMDDVAKTGLIVVCAPTPPAPPPTPPAPEQPPQQQQLFVPFPAYTPPHPAKHGQ